MRIDPEQVEHADRALATVPDEWLDRTGVIAVEVARRWAQGQPTDEVCIRVTVDEKLPVDQVPPGELFPGDHDGVSVQGVEGSPLVPE